MKPQINHDSTELSFYFQLTFYVNIREFHSKETIDCQSSKAIIKLHKIV